MKSKKVEKSLAIAIIAGMSVAAHPGFSATIPNSPDVPTQLVITERAAHGANPEPLQASDVTVLRGKTRVPVTQLQRLTGSLAGVQLFVLLDDSTRSFSLGTHLPELKAFLESLPASTEVAVGYMRNGTFGLVQPFTADHEQAASSLRLPEAIPGGNGSPYFALSDLAKHWPSQKPTDRRVALMLTDGVDRYYGTPTADDPYVDASIQDSLKEGVQVYSIYLRGAGFYGRGGFATNIAQSRLIEVSEQTGGHAYFEDFTDPISISQFLNDFEDRLANQYLVTIEDVTEKGVQPVKVRTELPGVKIDAPTRVYLR